MDNSVKEVVSKLSQLDERLNEIKREKKVIDDEVKMLEDGLLVYCQENQQSILQEILSYYMIRQIKKFKRTGLMEHNG